METVVETNFDELLDVFCHIQEEQLFVPVPAHNNEFYDFILDGRLDTCYNFWFREAIFIQVFDTYKLWKEKHLENSLKNALFLTLLKLHY